MELTLVVYTTSPVSLASNDNSVLLRVSSLTYTLLWDFLSVLGARCAHADDIHSM